ncbi:MAG: PD-(D/E)XK nuclease family protein, partial [Proteobacteria bacterium]|nr:PD-(D/E)XK nuclease family protein [Pseudomonadota bacterium]
MGTHFEPIAELARPRVLWADGPRALERGLVVGVRAWQRALCDDPARLGQPLRIVVPSRSLRQHLGALLVEGAPGRALAGVGIDTLHGLAGQVLARAETLGESEDALFPVWVRRAAEREPALRAALHNLADGYGVVEASVSDFLDAGFTAEHGPVLQERLAAWAEESGRDARFARAVVSVAERVARALEVGEIGHGSRRLQRAAEAVADPALRPAAAVHWIYGFADATGVATDFIEALVRHAGAELWLERPLGSDAGRECRFGARFRERVLPLLEPVVLPAAATPPSLQLVRAPGPRAEVREVAARIAQDAEAPLRPERIGVVARDLAEYTVPVRTAFRRLGLPFSGVGSPGPVDPASRPLQLLLELLREGGRVPADAWLDAAARLPAGTAARRAGWREDTRLALRHLGAARLADVAALAVSGDVALPVRHGLRALQPDGDDSPDPSGPVAPRRRLPVSLLRAVVTAAGRSLGQREAWPARAPGREHVSRLLQLAATGLGWDAAGSHSAVLSQALAGIPDVPLGLEEFALLCDRALEPLRHGPLGGAGGGVQVLTAMEARGRTFDRLYVLGLSRDVFPRVVTEDALVPDRERRALREVLPDLPLKTDGHDEERVLFAQLCAAAERVALSWPHSHDDGTARSPSTFLGRLEREHPELAVEPAPGLRAREIVETGHSGFERALVAALYGGRAELVDRLPPVIEEAYAQAGRPPPDAKSLATTRLASVAEVDRAPGAGRDLGPYLGFVGPVRRSEDLRRARLHVTGLESQARCGWRYFLEKLLRVEGVPDPLEALPDLEAMHLGIVVHDVLEAIAVGAGVVPGGGLTDALARAPVAVAWPTGARLREQVRQAAARALEGQGLALPGLVEVLARRAEAVLERARALDFATGPADVLGVEVEGETEFRGVPVAFRADRVDAGGVLTDYKTGKPGVRAVTPSARRRQLLDAVRTGRALQAAVYARAAGQTTGRYLALRPDVDDATAALVIAETDPELGQILDATVSALLEAQTQGAFVPLLIDAGNSDDPHRCQICPVSDACRRGDSGAALRVRAWLEREP